MPFDLRGLLKRHWYALTTSALILIGVALRLTLILLGWPHTNSEEGTMGLEAIHIFRLGAHPIYLYGQNYMGVGEAYLGALFFRIFGISLVSLRLSMVTFYAIFMVSVFWLASLLFTRRVALVSLAALALGAPFATRIELLADGGKAETLAFGALMLALASWLALTRPTGATSRGQQTRRDAAYIGWGAVAGLALYTYAIAAPFVLASGLLIAFTCWQELRNWRVALPIIGLLIGLLPTILYTVTSPLADNPLAVFLTVHALNSGASGPTGAALLLKQLDGALLYTLPQVTGLVTPYPLQTLPLYGPTGPATLSATLLGATWSLAYLALLGMATYRPLRALRQHWAKRDAPMDAEAARAAARLALALTAWLTIAAYTFSATAANNPNSGRYLIGLLVITPAILWPLLEWAPGATSSKPAVERYETLLKGVWRLAGLALLAANLVVGGIALAQSIPDAVAADGRDVRLGHALLSHGVTRFYSDYWACDLLNFETQERLTCAVINNYAQPGLTRYTPYYDEVRAAPTAPYVLAHNSEIERTFLTHAAQNHLSYSLTQIDGRDVYTPTYP